MGGPLWTGCAALQIEHTHTPCSNRIALHRPCLACSQRKFLRNKWEAAQVEKTGSGREAPAGAQHARAYLVEHGIADLCDQYFSTAKVS